VLIARALAGEPDVFVMDEPTAGVDAASQAALAETLRELVGHDRTIVLVAHELGPLEPLITRCIVLDDGCVAHDGAPPRPAGEHALPGHDHVHPHGPDDRDGGPLTTWEPI
jgi:zinc transport system ATP-binding protein